jgi:hypothetical protein
MSTSEKFEVEDFAAIGRTFEEYRQMFDLNPTKLESESILDCPSGVGSFVATAHEHNISTVGVDILYSLSPDELARRCETDYENVATQLREKNDLFNWEFYGDPAGRKQYLQDAYETFLDDYADGLSHGRYIPAKLPHLPFEENSFSMVLSAHFLFLYSDRLDYEFHLTTLKELARVASDEVRVFPLVGLDTERYEQLDELIGEFTTEDYSAEISDVPFEFQKGATEMLTISV